MSYKAQSILRDILEFLFSSFFKSAQCGGSINKTQ